MLYKKTLTILLILHLATPFYAHSTLTLTLPQPPITKTPTKKMSKKKKTKNSYPHIKDKATVRVDGGISPQEQEFLNKRLKVVQANLSKLLENVAIPDNAIPRIAICGSGGGFRSMIAFAGSAAGAENWGLLGITTYLAGVSGSTWTIAGFMQSGLTAQQYLTQLYDRLQTPLDNNINKNYLDEMLLRKKSFNQTVDSIDTYGSLIAQKILCSLSGKNNPHDFYIDTCSTLVHDGKLPLPVYTSVIVQQNNYQWVEFTPYEVGSPDFLKSSIPTWAFGRKFNEGTSTDTPPPQPLSYGLGIWGSGQTANLSEMLGSFKQHLPSEGQDFVNLLLQSPLGMFFQQIRPVQPTKVCNWNYGTTNPLGTEDTLSLADAGLLVNIPTPSFLNSNRPIDIIIIFGNSQKPEDGQDLKDTETYAKAHNGIFPPIDYSKTNQICSVHMDQNNQTCPVVIYLPLIKNPTYQNNWNPSPLAPGSFTSTINFVYTPDQVKQLSGLATYNISQETTKQAIIDAITFKINQKAPGTIAEKNNSIT